MRTMNDFYASLNSQHCIHDARKEYNRLLRIFEEDDTGGDEIPDFFAATTRLRSELEDFNNKPEIVVSYIRLLDADIRMMRAIINNLKEKS